MSYEDECWNPQGEKTCGECPGCEARHAADELTRLREDNRELRKQRNLASMVNASLHERVAELEKDAKRLGWLAANPYDLRPMEGHDGIGWEPMEVTDPPCKRLPLREAIDAAMAAAEGES